MRALFLLLVVPFFLQDVPFKPDNEFDIQLNFVMRNEPQDYSKGTQQIDQRMDNRADTKLPALVATIRLLKVQPSEARVIVQNQFSHVLFNRKIKGPMSFDIDMGYIADIQDGTSSRTFDIQLLDDKHNPVSHIAIEFRDGKDFYVNNEQRGAI